MVTQSSTPGNRSARAPSPVKRKKSVARSASPVKGKLKDRDDSGTHQVRSLSSLNHKPPLAPSHVSVHTPRTATATESSPATSRVDSPRPASPITVSKGHGAAGKDEKERVRVFVRLRPPHADEGEPTMQFDGSGQRLWLAGERDHKADTAPTPLQFDFDGILPSDIQQQHVYEAVARPLVDAATTGHSACLMCYGQTGTGKTYTFGGGELLKVYSGAGGKKSSKRDEGGEGASGVAEGSSSGGGGGGGGGSSSSSSKVGGGSSSSGGGGAKAGGARARSASPASSHHAAAGGVDVAERDAKRQVERASRHKSDELSDLRSRQGVVGRALGQIIDWAAPRHMRVCISYVQVYMELLQDLLRPESVLTLREHPDLGVYVDGACWRTVTEVEAACALVAEADQRRTTAFTKLNADSSRSHAVLLIAIRSEADILAASTAAASLPDPASQPLSHRAVSTARAPPSENFEWASARGRLFLVDLAGSERTKRSGAVGHNFDEACSINQSLTTLGRCIQALAAAGGSHKSKLKETRAPVRESKLTRLLSPCLGSGITSLVCCVSSAAADRFETQSTLEFGHNAMKVMLKPQSQLGVDFKALTIQLQAQLDERVQERLEVEAAVHARVHAEYESRLVQLEKARRDAETARQKAELAYDRREQAQREAEARAASAQSELRELQSRSDTYVKTSRASHDSRAAIIATADSLAEEVVRARRDRDEALMQLELLTRQNGGGRGPMLAQGAAAIGGGGGGGGGSSGPGSEHASGRLLYEAPEGASVVEKECGFAVAEISGYRSHLERRKMRARAATAKAGIPTPASLAAGTSSGRTEDQRAMADRKALQALRLAISGGLGGMSDLLAAVVELCETQHPELWQNSAEQMLLNEQLRASQRLVHILGGIQNDFAGLAPSNLDANPPEEEQTIPGSVAGGRGR